MLEFAHAVADLAGPRPAGRFPDAASAIAAINPFAEIGKSKAFASALAAGSLALPDPEALRGVTVQAAPGHPLCPRCCLPLVLTGLDQRGLGVRCSQCHEQRHFHLPADVVTHRPALKGGLADAHLAGHRGVEIEQDPSGATLVKCPNCHAPLDAHAGAALATCRYCGASSFLSPRALRQLGQENVEPALWWLLVSGPSRARSGILQAGVPAAQDPTALLEAYAAAENARRNASGSLASELRIPIIIFSILFLVTIIGIVVGELGSEQATLQETPDQAVVPPPPPLPEKVEVKQPSLRPIPELPGQELSSAASTPPVRLTWKATVTSSRGKRVAAGTPCTLETDSNGKSVGRTWVACGDTILYDSKVSFSGFVRYSAQVSEVKPKGKDGWAYRLSYVDTGQRTGRPQMLASSAQRMVEIKDENPGGFVAQLSMRELSEVRAGPPFFEKSADYSPITKQFVVAASTEGAPAPNGESCTLKLALYATSSEGAQCKTTLRCGRGVLYDTSKPGSYTPCELGSDGAPERMTDERPTTKDGDPSIVGELRAGRVTLSDDPPRGEWTLTLDSAE